MRGSIHKFLIIALAFLALPLIASADQVDDSAQSAAIVRLKSDHQNYLVGAQAILTADFMSWPHSKTQSYVLTSQLNGQALTPAHTVPNQEEVYDTGTLSQPGTQTWQVLVYLHDSQAGTQQLVETDTLQFNVMPNSDF